MVVLQNDHNIYGRFAKQPKYLWSFCSAPQKEESTPHEFWGRIRKTK
jgi:hypothetical protein